MSDQDAFLAAVHDAPDDDAPRLIFADWLDEHGEPDRAEFIRIQVEMRRERERNAQLTPRLDELFLRAREIFRKPWAETGRKLGAAAIAAYSRGFPDSLAMPAREFAKQGRGMSMWLGPQTRVKFWNCRKAMAAVADSPSLQFVSQLEFTCQSDRDVFEDADVVAFLKSPHLFRMRKLFLNSQSRLTAKVGHALASAKSLTALGRIHLGGVGLGDDGIEQIANSPHLATLEIMTIWNTGFGPRGAQALANSPYLTNLKTLEIHDNSLGEDDFARLLERFGREVLRPSSYEEFAYRGDETQ
jgi:uncharacterized protein (TIGR02996 family)